MCVCGESADILMQAKVYLSRLLVANFRVKSYITVSKAANVLCKVFNRPSFRVIEHRVFFTPINRAMKVAVEPTDCVKVQNGDVLTVSEVSDERQLQVLLPICTPLNLVLNRFNP